MIYAKTSMNRMPPNCMDCIKRIELSPVDGTYCGLAEERYTRRIGRPDWCPLVEIDETLPAQLATAKALVEKLGRMLDESE